MTYALGEAIEELATALAALSWELILIVLGAVVVGAAAYWALEHFANSWSEKHINPFFNHDIQPYANEFIDKIKELMC